MFNNIKIFIKKPSSSLNFKKLKKFLEFVVHQYYYFHLIIHYLHESLKNYKVLKNKK